MSFSHQHNDSMESISSISSTSSAAASSASALCNPSDEWVGITMIEDDDLMFGGKSLSTWYEEDRRCSVSTRDEDASSPCSTTSTSTAGDEEEDRGRRRDRPQYVQQEQKH